MNLSLCVSGNVHISIPISGYTLGLLTWNCDYASNHPRSVAQRTGHGQSRDVLVPLPNSQWSHVFSRWFYSR